LIGSGTLTTYAKFIPAENDGTIIEKVTEQLQSSIIDENSEVAKELELKDKKLA